MIARRRTPWWVFLSTATPAVNGFSSELEPVVGVAIPFPVSRAVGVGNTGELDIHQTLRLLVDTEAHAQFCVNLTVATFDIKACAKSTNPTFGQSVGRRNHPACRITALWREVCDSLRTARVHNAAINRLKANTPDLRIALRDFSVGPVHCQSNVASIGHHRPSEHIKTNRLSRIRHLESPANADQGFSALKFPQFDNDWVRRVGRYPLTRWPKRGIDGLAVFRCDCVAGNVRNNP